MKKGKLKKLLRDAFIAGGRYYIKGHVPVKIGKTQDFDRWYSENVVNNLDIPVVSVPKGTLCECLGTKQTGVNDKMEEVCVKCDLPIIA